MLEHVDAKQTIEHLFAKKDVIRTVPKVSSLLVLAKCYCLRRTLETDEVAIWKNRRELLEDPSGPAAYFGHMVRHQLIPLQQSENLLRFPWRVFGVPATVCIQIGAIRVPGRRIQAHGGIRQGIARGALRRHARFQC
jgi:hypothetical protein